jgi:hypothetical protein
MFRYVYAVAVLMGLFGYAAGVTAQQPLPGKTDWPLFGGTAARNMVNLIDKNIPVDWCVEKGKEKNVKW